MELKATNHHYYSSESNYYVGNANGDNQGRCDYETWEEFKEEWLDDGKSIDDDYNHCFRFDILEKRDDMTDEPIGGYSLWLFFILQRKGIYRPVHIETITEDNMSEIEAFLKDRWEYLKDQWSEINNVIED